MKNKLAVLLVLGFCLVAAGWALGQAANGWLPNNGSWWAMLGARKDSALVQGAYLEGYHAGFSRGTAEQALADSTKPADSENAKSWVRAINKADLSAEFIGMRNFYEIPQNQPVCVENALIYVDAQLDGSDVSDLTASSRKEDAKKGCLYRYKP